MCSKNTFDGIHPLLFYEPGTNCYALDLNLICSKNTFDGIHPLLFYEPGTSRYVLDLNPCYKIISGT